MTKPDFIDNRDGNTLRAALSASLAAHAPIGEPIPSVYGAGGGEDPPAPGIAELSIASAYFSPSGFREILASIGSVPKIRLMLGAEATPAMAAARRRPADPPEPGFSRQLLRHALRTLEASLRAERDHLPFTPAAMAALKQLSALVRDGRLEVRRYEMAFLHAKAYLFRGSAGGVIVGSSNLTRAGLLHNLELNLGRYDLETTKRAETWFDELWEEAVLFDLAELFEQPFAAFNPYLIFLRVLFQLYGDDVEEEEKEAGRIPLANFQLHGVWRALKILAHSGGAIVADEVGLGKTFIAGEIMRRYIERRQRVLVVCPAALRDSTWEDFRTRFQLFIEVISYEQLGSDLQLYDGVLRPHATQRHLKSAIDEYALIVVDEAHNYRNPDSPYRAAALRRLLFGPRKDLVLLTATPVNNSLWDLFNQIRFFVKQDAFLADRGILSIRERFEQAMRLDPTNLSPDLLYPIIDATTVKRTRAFVKRHYAGEQIRGPDGRLQEIVFPKPVPLTVRYDLETALPGFFGRIADALDPEDGADPILFSRYRPDAYLKGATDEDRARSEAMTGLLRSGLLKRFESSAAAFRKTIEKMAGEHELFLEALSKGKVITTAFLQEISGDDESAFEALLDASEETLPSGLYDINALRRDVQHDLDILRALAEEAAKIRPDRDPKLLALVEQLIAIAQQARKEAVGDEEELQLRKVLIFSFFADTVAWINEHLPKLATKHPDLKPYLGRMAAVSGSNIPGGIDREKAVFGFAPISARAPAGLGADIYDILISTDVLAEGMNLQQARHIINYDMPWNPMRLVQRHGRIDRIGSPHNRVFLRTVFPADRLDELLNLEQRILRKLAQAARSIGVGSPIEHGAVGEQVFAETREEIEKLYRQDPSLFENGGPASAGQTGEEYRQQLREALRKNPDAIKNLPAKAGSGLVKGVERGVFFCATVDKRVYLRFVRTTPDWTPILGESAIIHEIGTCLRLIECTPETPRFVPEALEDAVFGVWAAAEQHILGAWNFESDPANLLPKVRPLNRQVADFLRKYQPADMAQDAFNRALDIVEQPWPRREEAMLRDEYRKAEGRRGAGAAQALAEWITGVGIDPFQPPEPLPPIGADDIDLICWLAISPSEHGNEKPMPGASSSKVLSAMARVNDRLADEAPNDQERAYRRDLAENLRQRARPDRPSN